MRQIFSELLATFSNKPSFLSSKKIERFVIFSVTLSITIAYLILHLKHLGATDFVMVLGLWLGYGGANSILLQRDKKVDKEIEIKE